MSDLPRSSSRDPDAGYSSPEAPSDSASHAAEPTGSTSTDSKIPRSWLIGGFAALVLAAVILVPQLLSSPSEEGGPQPGAQNDLQRVSGYVVEPQVINDRLITTGILRADEEVELVSETSGRITQILFREGSVVQRGQLLLTINDAELQAERDRLGYQLQLAEEREQRQAQLLNRGGISQEEYDDVRNQVNVLRAEERLLQARIEKMQVRAPFTGTIGLRHVSEGSYLTQQGRIATLRNIQPIKIDFTIPERYAGRVSAGHEIVFRVEGIDRPFRGEVYAVEPGISAATRSVELRAEAPNPDGQLLPGAFATIELIFDRVEDAIVVPAIAVLAGREGSHVFVSDGGEVARRTVQTGIRTDSTVQVVQGLSLQDTVLISSLQQLQPGQQIRVDGLDALPEEQDLDEYIEAEDQQVGISDAEAGGNGI